MPVRPAPAAGRPVDRAESGNRSDRVPSLHGDRLGHSVLPGLRAVVPCGRLPSMHEPPLLRLQRIEVDGLFGIYDHRIDLNLRDRVTLLHGPNGVGKTSVLRMVDALLRNDFACFKRIPLARFLLGFEDGSTLELQASRGPENHEGSGAGELKLTRADGTSNTDPGWRRRKDDRMSRRGCRAPEDRPSFRRAPSCVPGVRRERVGASTKSDAAETTGPGSARVVHTPPSCCRDVAESPGCTRGHWKRKRRNRERIRFSAGCPIRSARVVAPRSGRLSYSSETRRATVISRSTSCPRVRKAEDDRTRRRSRAWALLRHGCCRTAKARRARRAHRRCARQSRRPGGGDGVGGTRFGRRWTPLRTGGGPLVEILRTGLRRVLGSLHTRIEAKDIAGLLRAGMSPEALRKTGLGAGVYSWQAANRPYFVLAD